MPIAAALDAFRPLMAMLIQRIFTYAPGRLSHARGQDVRMHIEALGYRARMIMERLREGTLRRHINRRRPPKQDPGTRNVAWLESPFPKQRYWLPHMIEEISLVIGLFEHWATNHDLPAIFAQAPQLRRALSPLFTALGLRLPKAATIVPATAGSRASHAGPPDPPLLDAPPPEPPPPNLRPPNLRPGAPLRHPNGFYLGWVMD